MSLSIRDFAHMRPGDTVSIRSVGDRMIAAIFECRDGAGYIWFEIELRHPENEGTSEYLTVEDDDGLSVEYFDRQIDPREAGVDPTPGGRLPHELTFYGATFDLMESDEMTVSRLGSTGSAAEPYHARYADYECAEDLLSLEVFEGTSPRESKVELWMGRALPASAVELGGRAGIDDPSVPQGARTGANSNVTAMYAAGSLTSPSPRPRWPIYVFFAGIVIALAVGMILVNAP